MIVTDGIHVTSTHSLDQLHTWARRRRIGRHWFHGLSHGHPHYDIPKSRRVQILSGFQAGQVISSRLILKYAKAIVDE